MYTKTVIRYLTAVPLAQIPNVRRNDGEGSDD